MINETKYPEVERLVFAVKKYNPAFEIHDRSRELDAIFYRRIVVKIQEKSISIPVLDEYEDVDLKHPAVLLHLILQECEAYDESEDFLVWTAELGLDPRDPVVRQIYFELRDVVPQLRTVFGNEIKSYSWV